MNLLSLTACPSLSHTLYMHFMFICPVPLPQSPLSHKKIWSIIFSWAESQASVKVLRGWKCYCLKYGWKGSSSVAHQVTSHSAWKRSLGRAVTKANARTPAISTLPYMLPVLVAVTCTLTCGNSKRLVWMCLQITTVRRNKCYLHDQSNTQNYFCSCRNGDRNRYVAICPWKLEQNM